MNVMSNTSHVIGLLPGWTLEAFNSYLSQIVKHGFINLIFIDYFFVYLFIDLSFL